MNDDKTAVKTAVSPLSGGTIPLGAHPGNTGGKKGRSGRRPNWIKDFCDDLLASPKCKQQVREILEDKTHPAFHHMWKAVGERAYGKPDQKLDVNVNLVEKYLMERHAARMNGNGSAN